MVGRQYSGFTIRPTPLTLNDSATFPAYSTFSWSTDSYSESGRLASYSGFTVCASTRGRRLDTDSQPAPLDELNRMTPRKLIAKMLEQPAAAGKEVRRQLVHEGEDGSPGIYFSLMGRCSYADNTFADPEYCTWYPVPFEGSCDVASGNEVAELAEKLCHMQQFGLALSILLILSLVLLIVKFICALVRCAPSCGASKCIKVAHIMLASFISLFMMLVVIIFGAACYPFGSIEEYQLEGVEAGFGAGFFCTLFGGIAMCVSVILSAVDCRVSKRDPPSAAAAAAGVQVVTVASTTSAVAMAAVPLAAADDAATAVPTVVPTAVPVVVPTAVPKAELDELDALKQAGVLTEEEYALAKGKILGPGVAEAEAKV